MTTTDIQHKLIHFIEKDILEETIKIDVETPLLEIGIDSISFIEIMLFSERAFRVKLPDNILTKENLQSVRHLANCIQQNLDKPR